MSDTAVFTFGRMNPPTVGHQKLVDKVTAVASQANADAYVYLSHTQNNKKDPLDYDSKIKYAKAAFGNIVTKSKSKNIIQILQELEKKHKHVILVVGSDRVREFDALLKKYNGKDFNFTTVQVASAGERDPDAEGVKGMSASKMRAAAQSGDERKFKSGLPRPLKRQSKKIFDEIRSIMEEDFTEEELELIEHWDVPDEMLYEEEELEEKEGRQPLTIQQRRKIGLRMRRLAPRMQRLKKIKAKRMAPADRLKMRARKAAINLLRKRAAGKTGANYANLSTSQKIAVDKMIMKKRPAIQTLAKRLFPKVRKKELERLQSLRKGPKTEEIVSENTRTPQDKDISKRGGTQPAKYHRGLSKSTKAKRDAQFKKQAAMSDDNPAAYKPAPGDATGKTKPSKYTKAYKAMYGESLDERMFGKTGPFGGKSQGSVVIPALDRAIDRVVNKKEYKDAVRAYLNFRRKNKSDPKTQGKNKENIAFDFFRQYGVQSPRQMIKYIDGLVKKGKLPSHLAIAEDDRHADVKRIAVRTRDGKTIFRNIKRDIKVEGDALDAAKERIKREKEADKMRHDRARDAARLRDTRAKNRQTEEIDEMARRGRPKKSGEVGIENIQMQLRKVISLRGQRPVEFENGKKLKMTPAQANLIDKKIGALRQTKDKQSFVQFITKSPENMKKALDPKFKKPEEFKSYLMNAVKESKNRALNIEEEKQPEQRVRFRHFSEERLLEKDMAGLRKKAEKSGISYGTLKKVYNRGVAAWRTGHRPGTTPSQWGYARVNAFITKKKKGGLNHDQDLA